MRNTAVTAVVALAAAALVSCTQGPKDGGLPSAPEASVKPAARVEPGPETVRDSFATLQATLRDTCTPGAGDCAYFLGRVTQELAGLDKAMRADAKGPGRFKEPLADMKALFGTLGEDRSAAHLEKHFSEIVGTRDGINTWMQAHPEDYR